MANPLPTNVLIRGTDLSYPAGEPIFAKVSFELKVNTCLGIYGPSGEGKSTFLKCVAQLLSFAGQLDFHQEGLSLPQYRSRVMYLPQKAQLQAKTVDEALNYPFSLGIYKHQKPAPVSFADVGLPEAIRERPIRHLSGGEAQRLQMLRALRLDPQILLLDEPTSALDSENQRKIEDLLTRWYQLPGKACIWISHDRSQLERIASHAQKFTKGGFL